MSDLSSANLIPFRPMGTITQEWLKAFAEASGDHNLIHLDEEVAKKMGLPGVIAHGMLISGLIHSRANEAILDYRNLRGFRIGSTNTRFRSMVLLGDEISVGGQWQVEASDRLRLDLEARNQKGETVVSTVLELVR
jgi:acyl dehydratase